MNKSVAAVARDVRDQTESSREPHGLGGTLSAKAKVTSGLPVHAYEERRCARNARWAPKTPCKQAPCSRQHGARQLTLTRPPPSMAAAAAALPDVLDVGYILASPATSPRYCALGSDALPVVQKYVSAAVTAAEDGSVVAYRACLLRVRAALEWLPRARSARLLQDCDVSSLVEAEEEWMVLETEMEQMLEQMGAGVRAEM